MMRGCMYVHNGVGRDCWLLYNILICHDEGECMLWNAGNDLS